MGKDQSSGSHKEFPLHNYEFYHAPSSHGELDTRFKGREALLKKLKSFFEHDRTGNGAYLVAGYRGMGKSSVISKAITELSTFGLNFQSKKSILILFALTLKTSILNTSNDIAFNGTFICFFLSFGYYLWKSHQEPPATFGANIQKFVTWIGFFPRRTSFSILERPLKFVALICIIEILKFSFSASLRTEFRTGEEILLAWSILSLILSCGFLCKNFEHNPNIIEIGKSLFFSLIKNPQIVVKINIGHEKTSEGDILKLIARQLKVHYQESLGGQLKYSIRAIAVKALLLFFLFIFISLMYYNKAVYTTINELKLNSGMIHLFPSQGYFLFTTGATDNQATPSAFALRLDKIVESNTIQSFTLRKSYYQPLAEFYRYKNFGQLSEFSDTSLVARSIVPISNGFDYLVQTAYRSITNGIPYLANIQGMHAGETKGLKSIFNESFWTVYHSDFEIIPYQVDYLFWLLFWLSYFILARIVRNGVWGLKTHHLALKRISHLNERIDAEVTGEDNVDIGGGGLLNQLGLQFKRGRTKHYPIASVREIEFEIIHFLNDVSKIPVLRPDIIVILDELDKIEPKSDFFVSSHESHSFSNSIGISSHGIRERQEAIAEILKSLKDFLNTAKAKFIFVAGREMYDASLADVANRDSSIDSIFHGVLYVNSFFSEKSDKATEQEITMMAEKYVCQFLTNNGKATKIKDVSFTAKEKEDQNILYHFINYLTFRSGGAPKRLTKLFEEFVVISSGRNKGLVLRFTPNDQYIFTLISNIVTPYFLTINRSIKDHGDKVIVSSSFLMDHLYKYHNFGFSWQIIDLTPEILDVNKSPELRGLIEEIVEKMLNIHLQRTINGLHQFKFSKRISEELVYASKMSERESAALNFTLDETLETKKHLRRKQNQIREKIASTESNSGDFIYALAQTQVYLGDLHYYDQEFDDALLEYLDIFQFLIAKGDKTDNSTILILRLGVLLRIGQTYERKRNYDDARGAYDKAVEITLDFKEESLKNKKDAILEGLRIAYQPILARLYIIEKGGLGGLSLTDVQQALDDFERLSISIDKKHRFLLFSEVEDKIGDVLFYKNGSLDENLPHCSIGTRCKKGGFEDPKIPTPCSACEHYMRSLEYISRTIGPEALTLNAVNTHPFFYGPIQALNDSEKSAIRGKEFWSTLANTLSDLGDTFLSCTRDQKNANRFLPSKLKFETNATISLQITDVNSKFDEVLICYYLAAKAYAKASEWREHAFELAKILEIMRHIPFPESFNGFIQSVQSKAQEGINRAYGHVDQLLSMIPGKDISLPGPQQIEIEELKILTARTKLSKDVKPKTFEKGSKYLRILELRLEAEELKSQKSINNEYITQAIKALKECLTILEVFGPSYFIPFSIHARVHAHLAWWYWKSSGNNDNSIQIKHMEFHKNMARDYFELATMTHIQGAPYQSFIEKLYYLDDNFNDNHVHFMTAKERFYINRGKIQHELEVLDDPKKA